MLFCQANVTCWCLHLSHQCERIRLTVAFRLQDRDSRDNNEKKIKRKKGNNNAYDDNNKNEYNDNKNNNNTDNNNNSNNNDNDNKGQVVGRSYVKGSY